MRTRTGLLPKLRVAAAVYRFRESLFLLPATIVLGGVVLAEIAGAVDRVVDPRSRLPGTVEMNSNAATWLLSTLAGATITTAGVVFSLTVVSLQLASAQFSPRVLRTFVRDRLSQSVVGVLVATFAYCVLVLRSIDANAPVAPPLAIGGSGLLALGSVFLIIGYLDHLARGLQVGEVLRRIGTEGAEVLNAIASDVSAVGTGQGPALNELGAGMSVTAPRDGWITQSPSAELLVAMPAGSTLLMETRAGAYVSEGQRLGRLWPYPDEPEKVRRRLLSAVHVGNARTMQEDVDFAFRQMVDIALRALSPAINDPTTAVEVVLRVGSL